MNKSYLWKIEVVAFATGPQGKIFAKHTFTVYTTANPTIEAVRQLVEAEDCNQSLATIASLFDGILSRGENLITLTEDMPLGKIDLKKIPEPVYIGATNDEVT